VQQPESYLAPQKQLAGTTPAATAVSPVQHGLSSSRGMGTCTGRDGCTQVSTGSVLHLRINDTNLPAMHHRCWCLCMSCATAADAGRGHGRASRGACCSQYFHAHRARHDAAAPGSAVHAKPGDRVLLSTATSAGGARGCPGSVHPDPQQETLWFRNIHLAAEHAPRGG